MKLSFKRIIVSLVAFALIVGALFQPLTARAASMAEYTLMADLIARVVIGGKFDPTLVPRAKLCIAATASSSNADAKAIEAYSYYQIEKYALDHCKKTAKDSLECASQEMKVGILKSMSNSASSSSASTKAMKDIECAKPSKQFENVGPSL